MCIMLAKTISPMVFNAHLTFHSSLQHAFRALTLIVVLLQKLSPLLFHPVSAFRPFDNDHYNDGGGGGYLGCYDLSLHIIGHPPALNRRAVDEVQAPGLCARIDKFPSDKRSALVSQKGNNQPQWLWCGFFDRASKLLAASRSTIKSSIQSQQPVSIRETEFRRWKLMQALPAALVSGYKLLLDKYIRQRKRSRKWSSECVMIALQ